MGDSSWLDAVPIGAILFAGTLVGFLRRWYASRSAKRGYPRVAEEIGLRVTESRSGSLLLEGSIGGARVVVDPEENCRIVLHVTDMPPLDLRNYAHWKRAPKGMQPFSFSNRTLNDAFPNRFGAEAITSALLENDEMLASLKTLSRFGQELEHASITKERVEVVFKKKHPAAVAPRIVRALVPALVTFACHAGRIAAKTPM